MLLVHAASVVKRIHIARYWSMQSFCLFCGIVQARSWQGYLSRVKRDGQGGGRLLKRQPHGGSPLVLSNQVQALQVYKVPQMRLIMVQLFQRQSPTRVLTTTQAAIWCVLKLCI